MYSCILSSLPHPRGYQQAGATRLASICVQLGRGKAKLGCHFCCCCQWCACVATIITTTESMTVAHAVAVGIITWGLLLCRSLILLPDHHLILVPMQSPHLHEDTNGNINLEDPIPSHCMAPTCWQQVAPVQLEPEACCDDHHRSTAVAIAQLAGCQQQFSSTQQVATAGTYRLLLLSCYDQTCYHCPWCVSEKDRKAATQIACNVQKEAE